MRNRLILAATAAIPLTLAGPALAADIPTEVAVPDAVDYRDIVVDLGIGAQFEPLFPSSTRYTVNPWPIVELQFLRLPFLGTVVSPDRPSFYVYPAFDFTNERDDADAHYLDGIDDVDAAFEIGAGAAFEYRFVKAFAEVRYGVTGHDGWVGEFGLDAKYETPVWQISAGPRLSVASANYMDTYFSVPREALRLREYEADAGLRDVGIEMQASYALTEAVRLQAKAEWTRFLGDAGDSPITKRGNEDEVMLGLGLTYRFGADLY